MDLDETVACAACGYDLAGLGWEGRCPECGGFYDKTSARGVVRGGKQVRRPDERGDRLVALLKVAVYALLGFGCLLWGGVASLSSPVPVRPLAMGLIGAGAFGFAAYAAWFIDRRSGP